MIDRTQGLEYRASDMPTPSNSGLFRPQRSLDVRLTTKETTAIKDLPPGKHGDGDGLWLVIREPGRGKWVLRYQMAYKPRQMGLGAFPLVTLSEAREAALEARRLARRGVDPLDERHKAKVIIPTFAKFAETVIEAQTVGVSDEHAAQWRTSLATYAAALNNKRVDQITTADVLAVLKPIWLEKPETADRVRNRIERILDAAKARGFRSGDNPAAWRGHLDHLLGKKPRSDRHHEAMEYSSVAGLVAKLCETNSVAHLALEFIILTATRLSETIEATWGEFDLDAKLWVIRADRMKAGKEHRVPLSDRACQILAAQKMRASGARVFEVSIRTIGNTIRRLDEKATTHGFRSSFRDWCGDVAHAPREIAEACLAHAIGNQTERSYRRLDALEARRALMTAWAAYVEGETGAEVVDLASRRA
jgi:integrase